MSTRRINLLPPEREERRRARQMMTTIVTAGVALVAILVLVFIGELVRLHGQQNKLKTQEQTNAKLQSQVTALSQFAQLEQQLRDRSALLTSLTADEVRWSVLMTDVSLVIPSNVWLTNLTATVATGGQTSTTTAAAAQVFGSFQMTGVTFSHVDVAKWLTRLAGVDAFTNPYLSISSKSTIGATPVVDFSSSVQLSPGALRKNQEGAERPL
ncbi:MAG: PilN domain-containing protein [Actinomycetota bacterium]